MALATIELSKEHQNKLEADKISIINIDVQRNDSVLDNNEQLFQLLEHLHKKEKEIFFNLITEEFLERSNPEY